MQRSSEFLNFWTCVTTSQHFDVYPITVKNSMHEICNKWTVTFSQVEKKSKLISNVK